jgi:histidine kinase
VLFLENQLLLLELVLVLSGKLNDPVVVNGVLLPKGTHKVQSPSNATEKRSLMWNIVIAYHLGDIQTALEMAEKCRPSKFALPSPCQKVYILLYDSMVCLAAARTLPKRRKSLLSIARGNLKKMRTFAKRDPHDGLQMVHLIEAELAAHEGNREKAMTNYHLSIASAKEAKFIYVNALAHERAGISLQEFGESSLAREHLNQALELYREWGAIAKADQMRTSMGVQASG